MANLSRRVDSLERKKKALDLRISGLSYSEIAKQLGYANASGAANAVKSELNRILGEKAEELRFIENERLDKMFAGVFEKASSGDPHAILAALRIMERRAKLNGLDAPIQDSIGIGGLTIVFIRDVGETEDITEDNQTVS